MSKINLPKSLSTALARADELLSMMATARTSIPEADAKASTAREAASLAQAAYERLLADVTLNIVSEETLAAATNAVKERTEEAAQAERLAAGLRARLTEAREEAQAIAETINTELRAFTGRLFDQALSALEEAMREPLAKVQAIAATDISGPMVLTMVERLEDVAGMSHPKGPWAHYRVTTARENALKVARSNPMAEGINATLGKAVSIAEQLERAANWRPVEPAPEPRRSERYLSTSQVYTG